MTDPDKDQILARLDELEARLIQEIRRPATYTFSYNSGDPPISGTFGTWAS